MKHPIRALDVIADPVVRAALGAAWRDSAPGPVGGRETGGFIVLEADQLTVRRWPSGAGDQIGVPAHIGCVCDGFEIVASFHTHPNTGPDYLQEPSETDRRGVRDDADLKGAWYVGEFVIAEEMIYLVTPTGAVREVDRRHELLG